MSHSPQAQIAKQKRQQVEYADDPEILWECINSDQVSASQLVQHFEAGEIARAALTTQPKE